MMNIFQLICQNLIYISSSNSNLIIFNCHPMKKYLYFLLCLFLLIHYSYSIDVSYVYSAGRSYGDQSPKHTTQPQFGNIRNDFYVCGLDLLESNWVIVLWNCNCGKRWHRGRRSWRCNYCENWFWSQVSAGRIKYCHKDNWENQITQIFGTGKTGTRNWRETTCPKGQYATGIAIEMGSEHGIDTGMVGVQLRCQNMNFTQKSFAQNLLGHSLTEMSKNPAKTFITGLSFKYQKNYKFTGIKAYFGQNLKPSSVTIKYEKVELIGNKSIKTIESIDKENIDIKTLQFKIKFSQAYNLTGKWINDIEAMNSIQLAEGTVIDLPRIEGTKIEENKYYKATSRSPFQFKNCQSITYNPVNTVPTSIPYCNVQKGVAVVEQQKVRASYTINLKYIIESTNQVIQQKVTGIYEGFSQSSIKTETSTLPIPKCKDD